jgi:predicted nucleotidyltransferase
LEKLKELVNKLINYKVRLIILFGSRARGDYTDESDIDVLIVADKMPSDPRKAYEIVRRLIDVKIHPLCLKTDSFLKKMESESTLIMEILKDGKTIYADKTLLEKAMSKYRKIRKKD